MAKFNSKKVKFGKGVLTHIVPFKSEKTKNLAGGEAYTESTMLEIISILSCSFNEEKFYENSLATLHRLEKLIQQQPLLAAKCLVIARTEYGMRSVCHAGTAMIGRYVKGADWTRAFFNKMIVRLDDITETLAFYMQRYGRTIPNAMKRGFAAAFTRFDEYAYAKYRGEGNTVSLLDAVHFCHPPVRQKNALAQLSLIEGKCKNTDTWEALLSAAGDNKAAKSEAWETILNDNQLGYFALLKNLRNIGQQASEKTLQEALHQLVDPDKIAKSMVLPFRFITAHEMIESEKTLTLARKAKIKAALETAVDISCSNVPVFDGDTALVIDDSGSMVGTAGDPNSKSPGKIAALFGSVLLRANPKADLYYFNTFARQVKVNPEKNTIALRQDIFSKFYSGGTNFNTIFPALSKAYDRVIILSDMQGWVESQPTKYVNEYVKKFGKVPKIFSFDLSGHGSLQFPEQHVYALGGWSDKVFSLMGLLEEDQQALAKKIDAVTFEVPAFLYKASTDKNQKSTKIKREIQAFSVSGQVGKAIDSEDTHITFML